VNEAPVISVVTPTWNRQALLMQAMDSLAAQDFANWEHIIVDDGSNDGTVEEVQRRAANDPRIRWMTRSGENSGASVCRNIGWRAARADLVVFLDSDDLLDPDSLSQRHAAMSRNRDLDFCVFRTGVFVENPGDLNRELDPEMIGDDLLRFLLFEVPWQTTAPTWRRTTLERLDGFDQTLPSWQDVDLHIRAIASGLRYLRFPRVDHHMRWHWEDTKVSIMQRRSPDHLRAAPAIVEKFERIVREGPGMTWSRQRALCGLYFMVALLWVEAGYLREGLSVWRRVRSRRLAGMPLHLAGAVLLRLRAWAGPRKIVERVINKWRGSARMRTNPDLVAQ
jgi:glycosyltransferase involved in cell wall biosynthesis